MDTYAESLSVPPDPLSTPLLPQEAGLCRLPQWARSHPASGWIGERKAMEARVFIPVPWAGDGLQLKVTLPCEAAISTQISFLWILVTTPSL